MMRLLLLLILLLIIIPYCSTTFIAHSTIKRTTATTTKVLWGGLYDDDIEEEAPERLWQTQRIFELDAEGSEVNDLLKPAESYTSTQWKDLALHVNEYPRLDDDDVLYVAKKMKCAPVDAELALMASKMDVMEAMVMIGIAQRFKLDQANALPDDTSDVDWDAELRNLNDTETSGEKVSRPLGMDGEDKRKLEKRSKIMRDDVNSLLTDKADQTWLPGKPNPKPMDDEPWFTG